MDLDNQGSNIDLFIQFAEKSLILTAKGDKDEVKVNHHSEIREQIDWIRQKYPTAFIAETNRSYFAEKIGTLNAALIVVDFQNDFVNGSLSIKSGPAGEDAEDAVTPINRLLSRSKEFRNIFYTMDWHPSNHISFHDHCRDPDRRLSPEDGLKHEFNTGQLVRFDEPPLEQALYPVHCVQNTSGAELYGKIIQVEDAKYIKKGQKQFSESYSAFVDNQGENKTELESSLRQVGVDALFICGLAFDVCVAATARDAAKLGFLTAIITDCTKGLSQEGIQRTKEEMANLGVAIITSDQLEQFLDQKRVPWQWLGALVSQI